MKRPKVLVAYADFSMDDPALDADTIALFEAGQALMAASHKKVLSVLPPVPEGATMDEDHLLQVSFSAAVQALRSRHCVHCALTGLGMSAATLAFGVAGHNGMAPREAFANAMSILIEGAESEIEKLTRHLSATPDESVH
jgi:hypothetical protein